MAIATAMAEATARATSTTMARAPAKSPSTSTSNEWFTLELADLVLEDPISGATFNMTDAYIDDTSDETSPSNRDGSCNSMLECPFRCPLTSATPPTVAFWLDRDSRNRIWPTRQELLRAHTSQRCMLWPSRLGTACADDDRFLDMSPSAAAQWGRLPRAPFGGWYRRPCLKHFGGAHLCCLCGMGVTGAGYMKFQAYPFIGIVCSLCSCYPQLHGTMLDCCADRLRQLFVTDESWPTLVASFLYPLWWPSRCCEHRPEACWIQLGHAHTPDPHGGRWQWQWRWQSMPQVWRVNILIKRRELAIAAWMEDEHIGRSLRRELTTLHRMQDRVICGHVFHDGWLRYRSDRFSPREWARLNTDEQITRAAMVYPGAFISSRPELNLKVIESLICFNPD